MFGTYHAGIVALSIVVAVAVCYAALSLAARVAQGGEHSTRLWLYGGALTMGVGVWSMHFIGMMAFTLPIPVAYDIGMTLASLVIAVVACGYALSMASRSSMDARRLVPSALLLGLGISAMHYTGMGAMTIVPGIGYEPVLLAASVLIGIAASFVALALLFRLRHAHSWGMYLARAGAALVMGFAISGMHYTGMAAARFAPGAYCVGGAKLDQGWLAITVGGIALGLITVTSILLLYDSHLESRTRRHALQLERANAQLQHTATHDALTDLPNRNLLNDRLEQAIAMWERQKTGFAVMVMDLDRFKTVNDSLGHLAGDELLRGIARRLSELLRATDTLARLGGDEFVIILSGVNRKEDIAKIADNVQHTVGLPQTIAGMELQVSSSMGIALCPQDGTDGPTLLKNADAAMYFGKNAGRNSWQFFTASMGGVARDRLELENGLRGAIANGQMTVVYQPKVRISSARIESAEALLRWDHPIRGSIPPSTFIPLAEESGTILQIGSWVLREACRQLRSWIDDGIAPMRMSVNVSARQLLQGDLYATVQDALTASGIEADLLELELTESAIMQNAAQSIDVLRRLATLGVRISVDDFGTGYSSLSYLRRLPLRKLKIDRSFIRDAPRHRDAGEIVRAIVSLAHSLNLEVNAEGVETSEQLEFVRALGCDEYQGYLCSRPLPVREFAQLYKLMTPELPSGIVDRLSTTLGLKKLTL